MFNTVYVIVLYFVNPYPLKQAVASDDRVAENRSSLHSREQTLMRIYLPNIPRIHTD